MLIGIKRAGVAYGRLIIHYHRFVFRKLHCHLIVAVFTGSVPLSPQEDNSRRARRRHAPSLWLLHTQGTRFCGVKKKRCDRAWALEGSTGDDKGLSLQHQGPGFFTEAVTSGYSSPSVSLSFSIYKMNTVQNLHYKLLSRTR